MEEEYIKQAQRVIETSMNINISVNSNHLSVYNFDRYIPNQFRFYLSDKYNSYEEMFHSNTQEGRITRRLLSYGFIYSFNYEVILSKVLIKKGDSNKVIREKNRLRNNWIKFALFCEKASFYNSNGKKTCGNYVVKWVDYYNVVLTPSPDFKIEELEFGQNLPITFYEMVNIYTVAMQESSLALETYYTYSPIPSDCISTFFSKIKSCNIPTVYFAGTLFPDYVFTSLKLLDAIFAISVMNKKGLDPGIPVAFRDYFTLDITNLYYNEYYSVIEQRKKITGFG
jgi:hypothetical protein